MARFQLALVATALGGCSVIDAAGGGGRPDSGAGGDAAAPAGDGAASCSVIDDFEDDLVGDSWIPYDDDDATVSESGGAMRVSFSGTAEAWAGYDLRDRFDFNEGEVRVEIGAAGGIYTGFDICFGEQELQFYVEDTDTLIGEVCGTPGADESSEVPYVPGTHAILRIRATDGVVYWEVSADGAEWELIHTQAAPFPLGDVLVSVEAGGQSGDPPAAFESFAATPSGCAQ